MIDPLGRWTTYEYDLLDRPVRIDEQDPDYIDEGQDRPLAAAVTVLV